MLNSLCLCTCQFSFSSSIHLLAWEGSAEQVSVLVNLLTLLINLLFSKGEFKVHRFVLLFLCHAKGNITNKKIQQSDQLWPTKQSMMFDPLFSSWEVLLWRSICERRAELLFPRSSKTTEEWINCEGKGGDTIACQLVHLRICIRRQTLEKVSDSSGTSCLYFIKTKQFCRFPSFGAMWLQVPLHTHSALAQVWD